MSMKGLSMLEKPLSICLRHDAAVSAAPQQTT